MNDTEKMKKIKEVFYDYHHQEDNEREMDCIDAMMQIEQIVEGK